jgi:hypothetical protein
MTHSEYDSAVQAFKQATRCDSLTATLKTTAIACAEARMAMVRSGTGNDALDNDLFSIIDRLESEAAKE